MEIISFIGIVAALILIILGSVRGYSLILLSTVAALLVAATGGVNVFENYANVYMGGVANMVLALFPIFLGGQMFGKMLEMSGLPMAVASGVFRKLGPRPDRRQTGDKQKPGPPGTDGEPPPYNESRMLAKCLHSLSIVSISSALRS